MIDLLPRFVIASVIWQYGCVAVPAGLGQLALLTYSTVFDAAHVPSMLQTCDAHSLCAWQGRQLPSAPQTGLVWTIQLPVSPIGDAGLH